MQTSLETLIKIRKCTNDVLRALAKTKPVSLFLLSERWIWTWQWKASLA